MGLRTAWHSPRAHDEREGSLRLVMGGEPANLTSDKAADSRRVIPSNTLPAGQRRCHPLYYAKMVELHVGTGIYDAARSETVVSCGRGQTSGVPAARAGGAAGKCRQGGRSSSCGNALCHAAAKEEAKSQKALPAHGPVSQIELLTP
jgi:hypothetical protein